MTDPDAPDPLAAFDPDRVFCCAVHPVVWSEFADALGVGDEEREALELVHDRQARRIARPGGTDDSPFDGRAAVVLVRA